MIKTLFWFLVFGFVALGQQPATVKPIPTVISGVVVSSSGKPIPGANVTLNRRVVPGAGRGSTGPQVNPVTSDHEGKFSFEGIAASSYTLRGSHESYMPGLYKAQDGASAGTILAVTEGQQLTGLVLKLAEPSTLSGTVVDEDGDPFDGALVSIMQYSYARGRRVLAAVAAAISDDNGNFKVMRIPPGRHIIRVSDQSRWTLEERMPIFNVKPGEKDLRPSETYYPGVREESAAVPFEVGAGQNAQLGRLKILNSAFYRARGKIAGDPNQWQGARVVSLPPVPSRVTWTNGADVQKDGSFDLSRLSSGPSMLAVVKQQPSLTLGWVPVLVGDRDLENVVIHAAATPLNIRVRAEDGSQVGPGAVVGIISAEGPTSITYETGRPNGDGSFSIPDVAHGKYSVYAMNVPPGTYVKSIDFNGQPVLEAGFTWTGGDTALQVSLGSRAPIIEGVVQDAEGRPVPGAIVTLVPNIPSPGKLHLYPSTTGDQLGRYRILNTPPGQYRIYAWEAIPVTAHWDPEFTRLFESRGERFSIAEGDSKAISPKAISEEFLEETLKKAGR